MDWQRFSNPTGRATEKRHALDFFLNVYDELGEYDDPVKALAYVVGDEALARHLISEHRKLSPGDLVKFRRPTVGDRFQREHIERWVDSYTRGE